MSFFFGDVKVTLTTWRERIAEVRDPETAELVDHMWEPHQETVDLTPTVDSIRITPDDLNERP